MADPLFSASILDELQRDQMHAQDIVKALDDLRQRLDEAGIPFALVGALAMRHYGYVRYTDDIDILTTREGLTRIHEQFVGRGLVPRSKGLKKSLRHTVFRVNIDVIQAGEHAGSHDSPLVFPEPDSNAFVEAQGIRIPTLPTLIELKLVSGIWGHRLTDLADVARLIGLNGLADTFTENLLPETHEKYLELLAGVQREVTLSEDDER